MIVPIQLTLGTALLSGVPAGLPDFGPAPLEIVLPMPAMPAIGGAEAYRSFQVALRQLANTAAGRGDAMHPALQALDSLGEFPDNWDREGAPSPSVEAITRANGMLKWATEAGLSVTDVDADVLGGVAIWLVGDHGRRVWLSCMNNGHDSVVMSDGRGVVYQAPLAETPRERVVAFLSGNADARPPA
jgi:hypothetical protein